ncbi:hypothetical protein D3C72_1065850 [compost metagenome]
MFRSFLMAMMVLTGLAAQQSLALSEPFPASPAGTLFASDEILRIEVQAPLKELFDKWKHNQNKEPVTGEISYFDAKGKKVTLTAKFRVKGNSTASMCELKKIEVKFKKRTTRGTLFDGVKSVDLNTHCRAQADKQGYLYNVHREVVLYRIAKLLKIPTYQSRAVLAQYRDTGMVDEDRAEKPFQAAFVEDKADILNRLNAREVKDYDADEFEETKPAPADSKALYVLHEVEKHPQIDLEDFERIALFYILTQNFDMDFPTETINFLPMARSSLWNLKMIALSPDKWVPLTHDFNSASAMSEADVSLTKYEFGWADKSTNERIRKIFRDNKTAIYKLVDTLGNDQYGKNIMKKTFDRFFEGGL